MSSIEKRAEDSWRVKFRHAGRQKSATFITEETALAWQRQLDVLGAPVALALLDRPLTSTLTVAEYLEMHIRRLTGVTDGTRKSYRSYVARDMIDIGAIPVALLDHDAVARWVNRLASQGLSGKSIANRHGLLSASMNLAVAEKLLPDNPCRGMRLPRTDHISTEMIFLSRDEFADIYYLIAPKFQPFVLTLVATGMRFSEATALTVGDIDLEARSVRIRQAWKMTGLSERVLGPPKSRRSTRTVALPDPLVDSLIPLIRGRGQGEFVFTNHAGSVIRQATFWRNTWAPVVQVFAGDEVRIDRDKIGRAIRVVTKQGPGKHPRIHDLRHTFASWAISDGVPMVTIQRTLGHESITTTIDRYGHLARADFDSLAASTARYLPDVRAIEG